MGGLFGSKPTPAPAPAPVVVKEPVVQQEIVDRQTQDVMRRRRGVSATVTGAGSSGSTAGSVAAKTLLGQ